MKYPVGSFEQPFAANSPWVSEPKGVVLGDFGLLTWLDWSRYYPTIEAGAYSTGVFKAPPDGEDMDILPLAGQPGVQFGDMEAWLPKITIPRWPLDVVLPWGSDGHCEIIDEQSKIIHSFWMLQKSGEVYRAQLYNCSPLGGRGWGDPAHYIHGARASAVPPCGGLIRKHEVNDDEPYFRHGLAMSLPLEFLSANPPYVWPATNQDWDYYNNRGRIPYGTRMFLHPNWQLNEANANNPMLVKLVNTLKIMGAYVVDRNVGTPFAIYAELYSGYTLSQPGAPEWNTPVFEELKSMIPWLAPMVSCDSYVDYNGHPFKDYPNRFNLMSMRGEPWNNVARYDPWTQSIVLPPVTRPLEFRSVSNNAIRRVTWAGPDFVHAYKLTVLAEGDATLRVDVADGNGNVIWTPNPQRDLHNGESTMIICPQFCTLVRTAKRGKGNNVLHVRAELTEERRVSARRTAERRIII